MLFWGDILRHHPELKRGDAFLHNSPYEGNSHAADHCLIVPVIDDDGVHRFFVLAKVTAEDDTQTIPRLDSLERKLKDLEQQFG